MSSNNTTVTPMMKQFLEIKERHKDAFLFFRMGDFYEMFFEDAIKASKILNITLTSRGNHQGKPIPMCGVPHHSVNGYLSKMVSANKKVAICEQVEDPKTAKGVVKREVIRVLTPGTVTSDSLLTSSKNNYLISICKTGANFGISYAELSTGEFKVTEVKELSQVERELSRVSPSEILFPKEMEPSLASLSFFRRYKEISFYLPDWIFEYQYAFNFLTEHFKTHSLDGFGLKDFIPGIRAAGALLHYVSENCNYALKHLNQISKYDLNDFISLDEATKRNLELVEISGNGLTLLKVLDHTKTSMGTRLLRNWILSPLRKSEKIIERQAAVTRLNNSFSLLTEVQNILKETYDIERIIGRIVCENANPRDLLGLKHSLLQLPKLKDLIDDFQESLIKTMKPYFKEFAQVLDTIGEAIAENTPISLKDGNVISRGFNQELDELRDISTNAKEKIAAIQTSERQKTGIKNLRIKFNNVFGYYLEVSKGQVSSVPEYFIRKQTLVNAERYITPELKELEVKILGAQQKSIALEQKLFKEVLTAIMSFANEIKEAAYWVAVLDSLASLAKAASLYNYVPPAINDGEDIFIEEGRHPVVERILDEGEFICNDTKLNCSAEQILLITGPNMAGKSTYIRQVALLALMAQTGSYVPAKSMRLGVVDRIFTRVGAYDDLSGGKSTFMVEMNEMANILNNASSKSLIILDEIGRGTSTYDGISIAWSIIEYLSYQSDVKAKTLFATHYHELTSLEHSLKGVKNYNIAVKEWNDEIMFLHKIIEGAADKSYGIHVARLAGMPVDVIKRAKELLSTLESGNALEISNKSVSNDIEKNNIQMELFNKVIENKIPDHWVQFVDKLSAYDSLNITPIEAIKILHEVVIESKSLK